MSVVIKIGRKCLEKLYYTAMPSYAKEGVNPYSDLFVKFPRLEKVFLPHVMCPTEVDKSRNRTGMHHVFLFFKVLIQTIQQYPDFFLDIPAMDMFWSEKNLASGTQSHRLVVEHGWLPRNSYQIAQTGANGRGAPAQLEAEESYLKIIGGAETLKNKLKLLQDAFYAAKSHLPEFVAEKDFVVVPMQLGNDLNLRDSSTNFSMHYGKKDATELFVLDFVNAVNGYDLPCAVFFTQHPVDRICHVVDLRAGDRFIQTGCGISTLDLIRHPRCVGVISVNSNVVHEAICLNIPCCVLGRLYWREQEVSPFETDPKNFCTSPQIFPHDNPSIMEYLSKLLCNQWYLTDFQNPLILRELFLNLGSVVPYRIRERLATI